MLCLLLASPAAAQDGLMVPSLLDVSGLDPVALDRAFDHAAELAPLNSLIVARSGRVVREQYFRGLRPGQRVNVKSASKSIISTLVGIAIAQGHLRTVEQRVAEFFPEQFEGETDARRWRISIRDLLSMRAGLESTSFGNYGAWVSSPSWVRSALAMPITCVPDQCWEYSTGNSHLLSAILTKATGVSTLAYARRALFEPIGVQLASWERDPQGIYLGGNNMRLSPRELLAFGMLYANGGKYGDRQIVPEEWIELSWQSRSRSPWNGHQYGYGWWTREFGGHAVHFAWGYGGQYLFVVPDLDLVVVATTSLSGRRPRDHNRQVLRLMRDYVMPAVRGND